VIGNILPKQDAEITLYIIEQPQQVNNQGASFCYRLSNSMFPQYNKLEVLKGCEEELIEEPYLFDFNLTIAAAPGQKISYVSTPAEVETCTKQDGALFEISMQQSQVHPKRDLLVFYKTNDMMSPSLLVEESEDFPD
jgi:hypothetical protein